MSKWEQYAVQEEYARKIGSNYGQFVTEAKKTVSIEVTDPDGTTRVVKFAQKPGDYQPTDTEIEALNKKVQFQFAYQLSGIDNEALIAEQVRPFVLEYNKNLRNQAATDRKNALAKLDKDRTLNEMTSIIGLKSPEEGFQYYENYVKMYLAKNGLDRTTGLEQANAQFGLDLEALVKSGKISQQKALDLIDHVGTGDRGNYSLEDSKGLELIRGKIVQAGTAYNEAKEIENQNKIATDVNLLQKMGPISKQQSKVLTEAFEIKYDGYIPDEITNVLKGYMDDDDARIFLDNAYRAQGNVLYPEQLRKVSNTILDQYKDKVISDKSHLVPGTTGYKQNQDLFFGLVQDTLETDYGKADIKKPNFIYLYANVEATYNDAYLASYAATGDEGIAHKMGMTAVNTALANPKFVAGAQTVDYTVTNDERTQVENISVGIQQGKNNQWKTSRMSMAGEEADKELLAWAKDPNRTVKTMPEYYVKVARGLGIPPDKFGMYQAALITQEPVDTTSLAEEMTEDDRILKLIFKNPNTYSVIQGVMMLEQEGEEVTKENSLFNNKSVRNEDI